MLEETKKRRARAMNNAKLMLEINHMTISFGGLKAADDISIQIHQG